jgi:hypothetical protein
MKKYLPLILAGMSLFGCQNKSQRYPEIPQAFRIESRPSYKLENLCDTEVDWKDITVYFYIEPSQELWEFHKYKDKIFPCISEFFREQKINCRIVDSNEPLKAFDSSNEFGVEVWDSQEEKEDRYWQLSTGLEEVPKNTGLNLRETSHAVTRAGISLINGKRKDLEWMSEEATKEQITELYKEDEEFMLKNWASMFSHEILHCASLFHTKTFDPEIIEENAIPNIMSAYNPLVIPRFTKENSLGYGLTHLQQKLIHSYLAGNNNYKAFVGLYKDLDIYLSKIAETNNLRILKEE